MHEFTNPFMIRTILRLSHKAHKCIQNSIMYILRNDKLQPLGMITTFACTYLPLLVPPEITQMHVQTYLKINT